MSFIHIWAPSCVMLRPGVLLLGRGLKTVNNKVQGRNCGILLKRKLYRRKWEVNAFCLSGIPYWIWNILIFLHIRIHKSWSQDRSLKLLWTHRQCLWMCQKPGPWEYNWLCKNFWNFSSILYVLYLALGKLENVTSSSLQFICSKFSKDDSSFMFNHAKQLLSLT